MDEATLKLIEAEMIRRGYQVSETVEEGQIVKRLIRPDGSVAVVARKPC